MFKRLEKAIAALIGPATCRCPVEEFRVFVEVLPGELADVVIKPLGEMPEIGGAVDQTGRYKSVDDAVVDAEFVGLLLRGQVKAENLLFVFGETVKSLQRALMTFFESRSIPYNASDLCSAVDGQESQRGEKCHGEPLAIVLCHVEDAKPFQEAARGDENQSRKEADCCHITWRELQDLYDTFERRHGPPSRQSEPS